MIYQHWTRSLRLQSMFKMTKTGTGVENDDCHAKSRYKQKFRALQEQN